MQKQGVISKVFSKPFQNKTLYSFQLQGDQQYYRLGEKKPPFVQDGASIQFDIDWKGNNASAKNVAPWMEQVVPAALQTPIPYAPPAAAKDNYWNNKEKADVARQKKIEIQAARNAAIEFISILLAQEAVKLPAKQADKEAALADMLNHYIEKFLSENEGTTTTQPVEAETINNDEDSEEKWG